MLTILLGNMIVLVPMVLNAHAGTKYGISFPVLCRAAFGVRGANVPAMLRAIVACGWFGIQTWIGALALDTLLTRGVARLGAGARGRRGSRSRSSGSSRSRSSSRAPKASRCSRAGRRRCCSAAARCCSGGGSSRGGGLAQRARAVAAACSRAARRLLGALPGGAHRERRLLGDAQPQHPRLHPLREEPALAGARPGARPADDDDRVRLHRRGGDERDDRDLRRGDLGPGRAREPHRQRRQ